MDANKDETIDGTDISSSQTEGTPAAGGNRDVGEFKIEVRKLELPVRPRGVLAE